MLPVEECQLNGSSTSFAGPVPQGARESNSFTNSVEFDVFVGPSNEQGRRIRGYVHDNRKVSKAMAIDVVLVHQVV